MADEKKSQTDSPKAGASASSATPNTKSLDEAFAEANAKGYFGQVPDETPNAEYTFRAQAKKVNGNGK